MISLNILHFCSILVFDEMFISEYTYGFPMDEWDTALKSFYSGSSFYNIKNTYKVFIEWTVSWAFIRWQEIF